MNKQAFLVHALSPLHAGTGHSADLVDLPTARMKGTNIPYLPGSSIKGVLRQERSGPDDAPRDRLLAAFGPETAAAGEHAGALVVGDARLLALPVRSFIGTFAHVTSPLLLRLADRDLGWNLPPLELDGRTARVTASSCCLHGGTLYLEDLDLPATKGDPTVELWATRLAKLVWPDAEAAFIRRFVIVDDETMTFLMETATQIDARVRMSAETRTVADGALWLEESLP
ncbi:MAG TPA: type III-B CRISPR module RAMP protein Cmr4, partial [Nannocystis sp.]